MYLALVNSVTVELVKEKCISFLKYKPGWYEGDGDYIELETVKETFRLIDVAQQNGFDEMEVNPEPDGSITLSLYYKDYMLDIVTYTIHDKIMWLQKASEEVYYRDEITYDEVVRHIVNFRNEEINYE